VESPELLVVHELGGEQVVEPLEAPRVERLLLVPAAQDLTRIISHRAPPLARAPP
jgi:hypothetical protein